MLWRLVLCKSLPFPLKLLIMQNTNHQRSWTPLQPATANVPAEGMKNVGVGMCPMNRTGMPVEIATAFIQLASPLGSYFTGECIHGTGGIEMQG